MIGYGHKERGGGGGQGAVRLWGKLEGWKPPTLFRLCVTDNKAWALRSTNGLKLCHMCHQITTPPLRHLRFGGLCAHMSEHKPDLRAPPFHVATLG